MTQVKLFRLKFKPNSKQIWLDWSKELLRRKDEVITTLKNEGVVSESCFLSPNGEDVYYFMEADDFEKATKAVNENPHPIDVEHKKARTSSLELIEKTECLFHFENWKNEERNIFDNWNYVKNNVSNNQRNFYVKPREVVWINLGQNIGDEENGKGEKFERPVLVLKVFNQNLFYGIPLSTKIKPNNKYYLSVNVKSKDENGKEVLNQRSVILSHARLLDVKRVYMHHGYVVESDFIKTKDAFKAIF